MTTPPRGPDRGRALLRGGCVLTSAAVAALVARACELRTLDVALWSVLVPLVVAATLVLVPQAARLLPGRRRRRAPVVLPDAASRVVQVPDPAVQAGEGAVEQARARLLAAQALGTPMPELLVLAQALHEADLELAEATARAGGHVPQALRDELALREVAAAAPPPIPYG